MALLEVETGTRCGIAVLVWPRLVALGSTVMKPCPKVTTQARAANNLSNAGVMSNGRSSRLCSSSFGVHNCKGGRACGPPKNCTKRLELTGREAGRCRGGIRYSAAASAAAPPNADVAAYLT